MRRGTRLVLVLSLLLLVLAAISLATGRGGHLLSGPADETEARLLRLILWELRLPRLVLALLVGAALGLSGAVLQGALRNPLADPGLLGVTGSASLGAVIAFYWGIAGGFPPALPLGGLLGAGLGTMFLLGFAGRTATGTALILAGVAVSALAAALLALALTLAPNPFALAEITFWLLGGLQDRTLMHVALAAPPIVLGGAPEDMADPIYLASQRVRIALQGHAPFAAATQAVYETLKALREGLPPKALKGLASSELTGRVTREAEVKARGREFLGLRK